MSQWKESSGEETHAAFHADASQVIPSLEEYNEACCPPGTQSSGYYSGATPTLSDHPPISGRTPGQGLSQKDSQEPAVQNVYNFTVNNFHSLPGSEQEQVSHCPLHGGGSLEEQMYQRLTHGEQTVLRDCTPMLVDSIDPDIILPYLMRHGVTTRDDEEFLLFPNQTTKQRNHRIMQCVLYRSPRLAKFLACLQESASEHSLRSHEDLAEVLRAKLHKLGVGTDEPKPLQRKEEAMKHGTKKEKRYRPLPPPSQTSSSDTESEPEVRVNLQRKSRSTPVSTRHIVSYMKLKWLQGQLKFGNCKEDVILTSKTKHRKTRCILEALVCYQKGKQMVLVLCNDILLLMKPNKPHSPEDCMDCYTPFKWFSHSTFTSELPLELHRLQVFKHSVNQASLILSQQPDIELVLHVDTQHERDYIETVLQSAIDACKTEHSTCREETWSVPKDSSSPPWRMYVRVLQASGLPVDVKSQQLICAVKLAQRSYKTRAVEGRGSALWDEQFVFSKFKKEDTLQIVVLQENRFRPNDPIGATELPVSCVSTLKEGTMDLQLRNRVSEKCGEIHIVLGANK